MRRIIIGDGKVSRVIRREGDIVLSHRDVELTSRASISSALGACRLREGDVVVNTAAKINLEWCEANKSAAWDVNVNGALHLAEVVHDHRAKLVHVGSGCIFDGVERAREDEVPSPACWYSFTKATADDAVLRLAPETLVLRPRQLVSAKANPTNMLTKLSRLPKVRAIDVQNSLTCVEDLGDMLDHLLAVGATGVYNCVNEGTTSPYEVCLEIKRTIKPSLEVERTSYEDYLKTVEVKRVNTVLDISKLQSTGFTPRSARDAVKWCLENYTR